MALCIPIMNGDDFVRFMKKPNSKYRIEEEYKSIIMKQGEEIDSTPEQNKELEIKGCLSYLQFLYYGPQLKNNQVLPGTSFVDGYDTKQKFLCTKNPLEEDCGTFWQTVWDNQVEIIVMTDQLTDKSYQYWSPKEKHFFMCGKFKIKTQKIMIYPYFTVTLLSLTATALKPKQKRLIFHYQYTAWLISNLCQADPFISFYFFVDSMYLQLRNVMPNKKFAPILVHCFSGLGSSQVFCVIDVCITQFEKTKMLSLSHVLEKMREQKHGSINSSDLYVLCYQIMKNCLDRA
uniref:Protein tyrosine phosphatase n=1 Tax=Glyptapanteles indiensis TaxID=92994 RepID=B7S8Z4_GLYIN|nr:protein tyrosine phosphatase [Glyptapanteles indiensis]